MGETKITQSDCSIAKFGKKSVKFLKKNYSRDLILILAEYKNGGKVLIFHIVILTPANWNRFYISKISL